MCADEGLGLATGTIDGRLRRMTNDADRAGEGLESAQRANRSLWDEWTLVHERSEFYDVAGFLAGRDSLGHIEGEALADVHGLRILHLQCHFGLDSLSLARRGAMVTGVDFSGEAIRLARRLAVQTGLQSQADFLQADALDLPACLDGRFDLVFTSWGVLIWLSDLNAWAQGIERCLRPGGRFLVVEFHPFVWTLDDERADALVPRYGYFHSPAPVRWLTAGQGSYADPSAVVHEPAQYEWTHSIGDVVSAVTATGLRLTDFREYPFCSGGLSFPFLVADGGLQRVKGREDSFPLSFALSAVKERTGTGPGGATDASRAAAVTAMLDGLNALPGAAATETANAAPEHLRTNLSLWDEWTKIHEGSEFYDVAGFRAGATALRPLELMELGDVSGKRLLHLQCHFGLDTLSWARLGATATGVDFSTEAIRLARRLAEETGLARRATFFQSDVLALPVTAPMEWDGAFDVVFVSYGAIEWLADLSGWATIVARYLRPGGTFYMAEIHPYAQLLERDDSSGELRIEYRYFPTAQAERYEVHGSYADPDADVRTTFCYGWPHSFTEITTALLAAGLRVHYLHEHAFSVAPLWPGMKRDADGWFRLPGRADVPFLYSLRATKD